MKSIKEVLKNNSESGRATLVTFISCGDPEISFTEKLVNGGRRNNSGGEPEGAVSRYNSPKGFGYGRALAQRRR